jgi:hypothetical protein
MFIIGLDLGQRSDYTAVAAIEKAESACHVRFLERMRGIPYPDVVSRVKSIMNKLPGAALVCDATGVGQPIVDMFRAADLRPIAVYITGGDRVSHDGNTYRIPKRDLVGVLQVLLQNRKLKIAPGPLSNFLSSEMLNFRVSISETAHDTYGAKGSTHDDLVLAVSLACWYASRQNINPEPIMWPEIEPCTPLFHAADPCIDDDFDGCGIGWFSIH